jgi:FKBP-type peptidyl-prolyl cis-trans isomerase
MRNLRIWTLVSLAMVGAAGCQGDPDGEGGPRGEGGEGEGSGGGAGSRPRSREVPRVIKQVPPPLELAAPPADVTRTASGLTYVKLASNAGGVQPTRSDTAVVHYTGWRQRTGDTFFTTRARGQPIALEVAHTAPGFAEALPLLRKGEKVVMWVPPSQDAPETLVYEIEVVDVVPSVAAARRAKRADHADGTARAGGKADAAASAGGKADVSPRAQGKADVSPRAAQGKGVPAKPADESPERSERERIMKGGRLPPAAGASPSGDGGAAR